MFAEGHILFGVRAQRAIASVLHLFPLPGFAPRTNRFNRAVGSGFQSATGFCESLLIWVKRRINLGPRGDTAQHQMRLDLEIVRVS